MLVNVLKGYVGRAAWLLHTTSPSRAFLRARVLSPLAIYRYIIRVHTPSTELRLRVHALWNDARAP